MSREQAVRELWFTRCPVPTATGIAHALGWFTDEFAADGIRVATIQDAPPELSRHHYDHEITSLIREGGNLLALAARAQGAPTRLIGLTWIDEAQAIIVRADSGIEEPRQLKGALSLGGLSLDAVEFVEVGSGQQERGAQNLGDLWAGLDGLVSGVVDAVYVKGASAVEAARQRGLVVGIDLDRFPDRRTRVNNGTPRPITVHESLLESHFDIVVRFLAQTLRAADSAKDNLPAVHDILKRETRAGDEGVAAAYRDGFQRSLHPDLSAERVELLRIQKTFMWVHGFLDADFDLDGWIDARPLAAAQQLLQHREVA